MGCYMDQMPLGTSEEDREAMRRIRAHFRQQMEERGLSQNLLAAHCGISSGTISKIMTSDRGTKVGIVLKLLLGLGISATRLLEENPPDRFFEDEPVPPPLRRKQPADSPRRR